MTTKEQVIIKSIKEVNKKLDGVNFLLEANPLSEICNIRIEAQKLLDENKSIEQRTSNSFIAKIAALSNREKQQFEIAGKGKDSIKLIDEKSNLECELRDLKLELYQVQRKK